MILRHNDLEPNIIMTKSLITQKQIIDYYEASEIDYRWVVNLNKNLALHFGYWDNTTSNLTSALEKENEVLARLANIKRSDKILDVGCGVGGSTIFIAKKFGCKATGITLSKKQVSSALKNAKDNNVENLTEFLEMDFHKTNFEDNSFDVVWAIESICHSDNKALFLQEAFRLLKPDGRLVLADGFCSKSNYLENENKSMKNWLNAWGVNSLETIFDFKQYLELAGFKKILFTNITKNILPTSLRLYLWSFPGRFFGKLISLAGLRNSIQTRNAVGAYFQYKTLRRGLWEYGIFYTEK